MKFGDARSHLLDYADTLVPENAAIGHRGEIALQNVQIGSANGGSGDAHDGISGALDSGARFVLPRTLTRAMIDQSFHRRGGASSDRASGR